MFEFKKLTKHLDKDVPAGLVVFLVALPLCLGIAVASDAPAMAGIITGIVGGIIVGFLSGSHLAVSGPAAGLTSIVISGVDQLGSFEAFTLAVVISGVFQLLLGMLRAGIIGYYFPNSVIKGMLSAIGIILIFKQIPHFLGVDKDFFGDLAFWQQDNENTISEIYYAITHPEAGAIIIGVISIVILIIWERPKLKRHKFFQLVPGALLVVVVGTLLNLLFQRFVPGLYLNGEHLVKLPVFTDASSFVSTLSFPDFSVLLDRQKSADVLLVGFTIALVASLETLLSVEATDKLDPHKRNTPTNRELLAQGTGNVLAGILGGLPMTAVIVRSSANVNANAQTKLSAVVHGVFLLASVLFLGSWLNEIPLAALAAILLLVGYKLNKPSVYRFFWRRGWQHFLPFIITILAISFSDLLIGIIIGLGVGIFFILYTNYKLSYSYHISENPNSNTVTLELSEQITFINKASVTHVLDKLPEGAHVVIDGSKSEHIDLDVLEIIYDFVSVAHEKNIDVELKKIPKLEV